MSDHDRRRRRRKLDLLLLVPALLVVLVDDVLWAGAQRLLRVVAGLSALRRMARALARLPAWLALPLFLIPESGSHLGTVVAAVLLVRRDPLAAVLCYAASKLIATVLAVWIYQGCSQTLLRVRWFAWTRASVLAVRDRGAQWLAGGLNGGGASGWMQRFRVPRRRLAWRPMRRR